jgi:hypothetical protein
VNYGTSTHRCNQRRKVALKQRIFYV